MKPIDKLTNGKHSKNISNNICNGCGEDVLNFRDALSNREYQISGMCQKCQDSIFGKEF